MAPSPTIMAESEHPIQPKNARPLLRTSTPFYQRIITDWWWWELASWFVSFACVTAIVGVLWFYDGKRQPEYLMTGITLNAYVAVLAAVSKSALILPVSEAIGQLKWIWFQREAALWDFQLFDSASRGPWGSVMLLIRTKCKHLVSLAAFVTILGLAFEPFFQQVLTYPERSVPVGRGLTWAATTFVPESKPILRQGRDEYNNDLSMTLSIDAAFNTPYVDTRPSTSECSTANCTWPTYPTLGVCNQCQDVSYMLKYICKNNTDLQRPARTKADDPCGFEVNDTFIVGSFGDPGYRTVTSLTTVIVDTFNMEGSFGAFFNTTVYGNSTLPIADFYVGYTPGGPAAVLRNQTPVLLECLLDWCVKSLNSHTVNGILQESVVDTITIQPEERDQYGYSPIAATLGPNVTFNIINGTTQSLRDWVLADLPPWLSQDSRFPFGSYTGIWQFHQTPPYDFDAYLTNITKAMTNNMKSRSTGTMPVEGTAWNSERFVEIRWAWITLPVATLIGSLVLVCATILKGRKSEAPVWKSSALATLIHGLSEGTRNRIDPDLSSSQTEAIATKLKVQLSSGEGNARLIAI